MLCLISLVYLTGLVAGGSIDTIDFDGDLYEGDDRSIFSSGGTYYIALNTTYVIYAAIIAGKTKIFLMLNSFSEKEAHLKLLKYYKADVFKLKKSI